MSGVDVAPLVLYSDERDRVLRLARLRNAPIVVTFVYSGAEQRLEREVACGVTTPGLIPTEAVVDDVTRCLHCGGQFPLDEAEVAAVQAWLTAVYAR